jgi:type IV pilus assembly protein PilB
MVGEIRDFETAEIAIKASLTGHMVLSTLHTNDAPSTINRLLNMGIEPFLVASSVNAVVAQRLARRICAECKTDDTALPREAMLEAGVVEAELENFMPKKGNGCQNCAETGYKGRVALYEVMLMGETLKEFVLNGASALEIKKEAIRQGMATLRRSALNKFLQGLTTLDEVVGTSASDR